MGGAPIREQLTKKALFTQLWNDPTARSRNANFGRFRDDRTYRLTVKHVRALLVFLDDLDRYRGRCEVDTRRLASGRGSQITLRIPELFLKRILFVAAYELDALARDPRWQCVAVHEEPLEGAES